MLAAMFANKLKRSVDTGKSGSRTRIIPHEMEAPLAPLAHEPSRQLTRKLTRQLTTKQKQYFVPPLPKDERSVSDLRISMKNNMASIRAKLADVHAIGETLRVSQVDLQSVLNDAEDSAGALQRFNEEMKGDFELMTHKEAWNQSISGFVRASLGENKNVEPSMVSLAEFLCETLALAEPEVEPRAGAVVFHHPQSRDHLKVFAADEASELRAGATLREGRTTGEAAEMAFEVMKTGEPDLNNPHGLDEVSKVARSIAPLKSTAGETFGLIVSGPSAVPDEYLEAIAKQAGPLLERVWKTDKAHVAIRSVVDFVKTVALDAHKLVYVDFAPLKEFPVPVSRGGEEWQWQPLLYSSATDGKTFEQKLKWRLGEPIGMFTCSCGTFTPLDEELLVMLHTVAAMLEKAVDLIEELTPGDKAPFSTTNEVLIEYEKERLVVPELLQSEMKHQLRTFDAFKIFNEVNSYESKAVDDQTIACIQSFLAALGHPKKNIKTWSQIQKTFRNPRTLHDQMLSLDFVHEIQHDQAQDNKFIEDSISATKGIDLEDLGARLAAAPPPVAAIPPPPCRAGIAAPPHPPPPTPASPPPPRS